MKKEDWDNLGNELGVAGLKRWGLYIKSHCEAPDYEREVDARSKDEALDIFMRELEKYGWGDDEVERHIFLIE